MKSLIILTNILLSTAAYSYSSMKEHAEVVESIAINKLTNSTLKCFDADKSGYYVCVHEKDYFGRESVFDNDHDLLVYHIGEMNKHISGKYPPLRIVKKD